MASVPEAACCYAALILQDGGIPITAEKIATLVKAANVNVESCWPRLFAKLFEKYNIEDLITNVGAGGGGSAPVAAATPIAAAGGSDAGGERLMELPFHVIDGIFSRLPVKSLIRYGLLSRRCLLRLKDPRFIKLHLQSNTHSSVVFYQDFQLWSADLDSLHDPQKANHQVTQYSEIGPHNFKYMGYVILAGSCDGLICLYDDWDRILILWNMSTNEHLTKRFPDDSVKMLGFGYDPFDDDYKVVMGKRTLSDKYHELIFYSLRSSSWSGYKEMSFQGYDPTYSALCRGGINVEGALHWVQRNYESYVLLALDIHTAQCQVLPLPHDGEMALEVFRGHLCAMESYDPRNPKPMGFWVMKDYGIKESWTKLFSVPVFRNASSELHYDPRGSSKNGDELLLLIKECMLYSYNWKTGEARRVNISTSRQVLTCQQSLLPLTGYNDIIAV